MSEPRVHYMKLGAAYAYCGTGTKRVKHAYDDWAKVTCLRCLAHPAAPSWAGVQARSNAVKGDES